jgi:hypothetical protein
MASKVQKEVPVKMINRGNNAATTCDGGAAEQVAGADSIVAFIELYIYNHAQL